MRLYWRLIFYYFDRAAGWAYIRDMLVLEKALISEIIWYTIKAKNLHIQCKFMLRTQAMCPNGEKQKLADGLTLAIGKFVFIGPIKTCGHVL